MKLYLSFIAFSLGVYDLLLLFFVFIYFTIRELRSLENEIKLLRTLLHPNIVRYIGTEITPVALSIFLVNAWILFNIYIYIYIYIVIFSSFFELNRIVLKFKMYQEYIPGGSLKSLIEKFGRLDEAVVRTYSRQLLLGLEYLHRCGIAHRDIKVCVCVCVCVFVCVCV